MQQLAKLGDLIPRDDREQENGDDLDNKKNENQFRAQF
jgi:hypothetical protein